MSIDLINKIKISSKIEDIIDMSNFKKNFNELLKSIHPDICKLNGAKEATVKLIQLKDIFENGREIKDDVGFYKTNGYWVEFLSDKDPITHSIENFNNFQKLKSKADINFQKYLPKECIKLPNGNYRFNFDKRAIPLVDLELTQEHTNWVLNRLLEYSAYLASIGFSHCGLNPESVFIVPETHGIQICSFYHLTKIGTTVKTVSAKYANWYPSELFKTKIANYMIDIELSKRIASYLLGDKSGSGVKLRKTHNIDFVNFIINQSVNTTSFEVMDSYKKLLNKNFKKQFHILEI